MKMEKNEKANEKEKTSTGLNPNVAALLSYLVGWITGLVFFLMEKENKFIRFHALQSIITFGALSVIGIVLSVLVSFLMMIRFTFIVPLFILIGNLLGLLGIILWIVLMVKAYQGEKFKLPFIGAIVENNL
jgi:uncharacterized membrane protein